MGSDDLTDDEKPQYMVDLPQFWMARYPTTLELTSIFHECEPGRRKLAVKVVDMFGNDTMTIVEVNVGGNR